MDCGVDSEPVHEYGLLLLLYRGDASHWGGRNGSFIGHLNGDERWRERARCKHVSFCAENLTRTIIVPGSTGKQFGSTGVRFKIGKVRKVDFDPHPFSKNFHRLRNGAYS